MPAEPAEQVRVGRRRRALLALEEGVGRGHGARRGGRCRGRSAASARATVRNGSAAAGYCGGAMSSAAPWLVRAPRADRRPSRPRTWSWIEPLVPMRMMVRMPAWTSSLTTMLVDGAPMPLVAQTTGRPPGRVATKASRPRLRASARPSARCSVAISSDRPGSPLSRAMVGARRAGPSGRSRCGTAGRRSPWLVGRVGAGRAGRRGRRRRAAGRRG